MSALKDAARACQPDVAQPGSHIVIPAALGYHTWAHDDGRVTIATKSPGGSEWHRGAPCSVTLDAQHVRTAAEQDAAAAVLVAPAGAGAQAQVVSISELHHHAAGAAAIVSQLYNETPNVHIAVQAGAWMQRSAQYLMAQPPATPVMQPAAPWLPDAQAQATRPLSIDQLADAAACYALAAGAMPTELHDVFWPWTAAEWRPSTEPRTNLQSAAALLLEAIRMTEAADASPKATA